MQIITKKWLAFIGISLLSFGCYLDYTVVNVALPTIQQALHASLAQLQWVMNIYFLALCILATIMGQCGDLYGRRRLFYIGVFIFAIASLLAGFAGDIHWLIVGRLLQGVGAAIVLPLGPSLLPEAFPEHERSKAIAWFGSLGGLSLALGPVLGGLIVSHWGWRWIFFINIPIVLIGFLACINSVKESLTITNKQSLDYKGMLLLAMTMGGIVLSLLHSTTAGWSNFTTLAYLVVGILAGISLIKVERHAKNPLIDVADFKKILFYAGSILIFISGVLSAVTLFFDPLYLQIIRGQSAQLSGIFLFAIPVTVLCVALFIGWVIEKIGILNTITFGLPFGVVACLLQAFFTASTPAWYILIAFICLGAMWAVGNTASIIAAQHAVPHERKSVATGMMVTLFNIGGSIGLALATMIYHLGATNMLQKQTVKLDNNQVEAARQLIDNPGNLFEIPAHSLLHEVSNYIFMQGFSTVMWFLFALSFLALLSVVGWKMKKLN